MLIDCFRSDFPEADLRQKVVCKRFIEVSRDPKGSG